VGGMNADCRLVRDLLPQTLLQEPASEELERVQEHLRHCSSCRAEHERVASLLGGLAATEVPDPGGAYWDSFLLRLRGRIAMEEAAPRLSPARRVWATAAGVLLLVLSAVAVLGLQPSGESRARMALGVLAARTSRDTLDQALDEILPGSDLSRRGKEPLSIAEPAELQRALDSLLPSEKGELGGVAEDLPPEARRWLVKTLMPDRV